MQHSSYANKKDFKKENILTNLLQGIFATLRGIYFIGNIVIISIGGFFLFLLDFALVKSTFDFILARAGIYVAAQYLTLLPTYIVIILVLLPTKYSLPITLLCSFFSFFILFSI